MHPVLCTLPFTAVGIGTSVGVLCVAILCVHFSLHHLKVAEIMTLHP